MVGEKDGVYICKATSLGKDSYNKKKNNKKNKIKHVIKTIKIRPSIGDNDLDIKISQIKLFISKKYKVSVVMMFKGRERSHTEIGKEILDRVKDEISDISTIESKYSDSSLSLYISP